MFVNSVPIFMFPLLRAVNPAPLMMCEADPCTALPAPLDFFFALEVLTPPQGALTLRGPDSLLETVACTAHPSFLDALLW